MCYLSSSIQTKNTEVSLCLITRILNHKTLQKCNSYMLHSYFISFPWIDITSSKSVQQSMHDFKLTHKQIDLLLFFAHFIVSVQSRIFIKENVTHIEQDCFSNKIFVQNDEKKIYIYKNIIILIWFFIRYFFPSWIFNWIFFEYFGAFYIIRYLMTGFTVHDITWTDQKRPGNDQKRPGNDQKRSGNDQKRP